MIRSPGMVTCYFVAMIVAKTFIILVYEEWKVLGCVSGYEVFPRRRSLLCSATAIVFGGDEDQIEVEGHQVTFMKQMISPSGLSSIT